MKDKHENDIDRFFENLKDYRLWDYRIRLKSAIIALSTIFLILAVIFLLLLDPQFIVLQSGDQGSRREDAYRIMHLRVAMDV